MNKSELIEHIAKNADISKAAATRAIERHQDHAAQGWRGSAIGYLARWRAKGGIEDLKKARHFIDLLIEMEVKKPCP